MDESMNRRSAAVMNWRNRTKLKLIEYKGGKCDRCGYNKKVPSAYDFHHNDPSKKDFGISGKSWSYEKLKKETDKCTLLCKTCHSEVHWEQQQLERVARHKVVVKNLLQPIQCKNCGKRIQPKNSRQLYCKSSCAKESQRRVKRPNKQQLAKDIGSLSWTAIGRKYGVSDNAIRKWAKAYSLIWLTH